MSYIARFVESLRQVLLNCYSLDLALDDEVELGLKTKAGERWQLLRHHHINQAVRK